MKMESLRNYHGLAKYGWDGLTSGGVYYEEGNHVRCTELEECMSAGGSDVVPLHWFVVISEY